MDTEVEEDRYIYKYKDATYARTDTQHMMHTQNHDTKA